jgi:O-glycosyl hydrolase
MQSDGTNAASFIPTLFNTLKAAGLSSVGITCCDAEGWNSQKTMTAQLVSAGMEQYLSRITSHSYTSDPNSAMSTKLPIWQTEAADLNDAWCTTWYSNGGACEGLTWAQKIYTGIVNANLSAYLYWEGVEVNQLQASSYLVASNGNTVTPSGRLWAFAMWSRFIRPGAHRVSTTGTVSGVGLAAFKNSDGSIVVVFTNTGSTAPSVKLSFTSFTPTSATAWLTDNTHQVAVTTSTLSAGALTVTVPAHSLVTVKLVSSGAVSVPPTSTISTSVSSVVPSTISTSPTTSTSPTAPGSGTQAHWDQCGGLGWTGGTVCVSPFTCTVINAYYWQCL